MKGEWTVYVVKCSDGTLYTGISKNLDKRLATHNAGKGAKYTRTRRPVVLMSSAPGFTHGDALRFERLVKRLPSKRKVAAVKEFS